MNCTCNRFSHHPLKLSVSESNFSKSGERTDWSNSDLELGIIQDCLLGYGGSYYWNRDSWLTKQVRKGEKSRAGL